MSRKPQSKDEALEALDFIVNVLKEHEKDAVYQMVIRFQSIETAAAWRDSSDHKALSPKIKALYKESTVQVYEVIAPK